MQRLRGIQTLLETAAAEDRIAISKNQFDVVHHMMQGMSVSADRVGEVAAAISSVPWATASEATVLLQAVGSMVSGRTARTALQDFELVCSFLSEPMWDMLLGSNDFFAKADGLIEHFSRLGLRNPTERSVANLTSLLLFACEQHRAKSLSPQHVRDTFLHFKGMLKKKLSKLPSAVAKLGPSPIDFRANHPDVYDAVFNRFPPVEPRIDPVAVYTLGASVKMRDRSSGASSSLSMSSAVPNDMQLMFQHMMTSTMRSMMGGMRQNDVPLTFFKPPRGMKVLTAGETAGHSPMTPHHDAVAVAKSHSPAAGHDHPQNSSGTSSPAMPPASPLAASTPSIVTAPAAPTPTSPVVKKSVDEAAAAILAAMGKKKKAGEKDILKRPAAAMVGGSLDDDGHDSGRPPIFSIEASRSQVLFRTGLTGKNQSKVFKYTNAASKAKAIAEAQKMVKAEKLRRGME